jgi:flagellar biosynthesis chaperone FliJ
MSNRFRLGIVLRLREMAEETARIELGHAVDAHQHAVAAVEAAQGRAGQELRWLSDLQHGTRPRRPAADRRLRGRLGPAGHRRRPGAARSGHRRALRGPPLLADATRQREVVERLRDRFLAAERREREHQDTLAMAEIASTQHAVRAARNADELHRLRRPHLPARHAHPQRGPQLGDQRLLLGVPCSGNSRAGAQ